MAIYQIKAQLYENTPKKDIQAVFQTSLPAVRPQEGSKDTYGFDFIDLHADPNEKDLEEKIQDEDYMKSFGSIGFTQLCGPGKSGTS